MAAYQIDGLKSHLQADCLYTGISSCPVLGNEYGETFAFPFTVMSIPDHADKLCRSRMSSVLGRNSLVTGQCCRYRLEADVSVN